MLARRKQTNRVAVSHIVRTGDVQVACQVWDIGGQTIGGGMLENYIYGADVSVLGVHLCTTFDVLQAVNQQQRLVNTHYFS